ncbi:hypothetical protein L1987_37339 [Smallanthus sonchifolius]|uniref:Uncharacterized protein n=1 Tax=Smallanthus sonchifolius TaxID=185202 RepID=A0ACB9HGS5_9ASTR|nr:hypothetical protein L1987_37339 [Smallanthus sonchifolius]
MTDSSISHYQLKRPLKQQRDFTLSPTLYSTGILSSGSAPTAINFTGRLGFKLDCCCFVIVLVAYREDSAFGSTTQKKTHFSFKKNTTFDMISSSLLMPASKTMSLKFKLFKAYCKMNSKMVDKDANGRISEDEVREDLTGATPVRIQGLHSSLFGLERAFNSLSVMQAVGSLITNKYSEGYKQLDH